MVIMIQLDNMLTMREVSKLLRIHPNTLRRWCDRGRIRTYRIIPRGDRRFRREDIAHFLEKMSTPVYPLYEEAKPKVMVVRGNGGLQGRKAQARGKVPRPTVAANRKARPKARPRA
jgi:excisionase family DNA binding protein